MNTKNVLIATVFAVAASSAFAADYVATAGNPEMQIAQATTQAPVRTSTKASAVVSGNDAAPVVYANTDKRSRSEVRAETRAWENSAEGRDARVYYFGGAQ